ncbi:peptidylprolyl isomerase [Desulfosarcina sp.]|uniref:peptidylprolyl isomerase n=1 Tax=Desulfosarcina sp. TaxID=2027861 RepID=UPI0029B65E57|nr:peptidylprolyl isomerase [Desulfosarcina sp.]MDX2451788.1 peptidylprolyl isomerase [Desulfosarcina sp.]MDX2489572.1 peptidylprolyl isomerase [Desulfosarcina sp.]
MKKYIVILVLVFWMGTGLSVAADALPRVKLTTSQGDVVLELNSAAAPKTVDNFLAYVKDGYYDGAIFHRVIAGFMIQGGGFDAEMKRKSPRPPIVNEADNGLPNRTGTIAMARTADPHSASAQFFINVKDNAFLDHRGKTAQGWGYCVFGKVVQGMEVVRTIENVPTTSRSGMGDVPKAPVVIEQATVVTTQ